MLWDLHNLDILDRIVSNNWLAGLIFTKEPTPYSSGQWWGGKPWAFGRFLLEAFLSCNYKVINNDYYLTKHFPMQCSTILLRWMSKSFSLREKHTHTWIHKTWNLFWPFVKRLGQFFAEFARVFLRLNSLHWNIKLLSKSATCIF